jgi:hypothetical protein
MPNPWASLRDDQLIPVNKAVNKKEQLEKGIEEEKKIVTSVVKLPRQLFVGPSASILASTFASTPASTTTTATPTVAISGDNVMITIFVDFHQLSAKKFGDFLLRKRYDRYFQPKYFETKLPFFLLF